MFVVPVESDNPILVACCDDDVDWKFKIDDAVGAVAVHGYAGFVGLVICGFVLNGFPIMWL